MEKYSAVGNVIEKIVQDHGMNALLDTQFATMNSIYQTDITDGKNLY